jgi:hypothetical protein
LIDGVFVWFGFGIELFFGWLVGRGVGDVFFFLGLDGVVVCVCVCFWFLVLFSILVSVVFLHFRFVSCGVNAGSMVRYLQRI